MKDIYGKNSNITCYFLLIFSCFLLSPRVFRIPTVIFFFFLISALLREKLSPPNLVTYALISVFSRSFSHSLHIYVSKMLIRRRPRVVVRRRCLLITKAVMKKETSHGEKEENKRKEEKMKLRSFTPKQNREKSNIWKKKWRYEVSRGVKKRRDEVDCWNSKCKIQNIFRNFSKRGNLCTNSIFSRIKTERKTLNLFQMKTHDKCALMRIIIGAHFPNENTYLSVDCLSLQPVDVVVRGECLICDLYWSLKSKMFERFKNWRL